MQRLNRSIHLSWRLASALGVIVCTVARTASASLPDPANAMTQSAPFGVSGRQFVEQVHQPGVPPTLIRPNNFPIALAGELEEPSFSPDGLRNLAGQFPPGFAGGLDGWQGPNRGRFLLWGGFSAAAVIEAFRQSQAAWGASNGKFHFKSDFRGDRLAMTDEASHLLVAFHLSRLIASGYRWSGFEPKKARLWGSAEAWLLTLLVEYPIDAYNPQQGLGVSDLLFNTIGAVAAYGRMAAVNPRWDIKVSVKPRFFNGTGRVVAYNSKQFDDFVYWLTYRPVRTRYVPVLLGLGYSTSHPGTADPVKELRIGLGTSLEEIGEMIGPRAERFLRPLSFFFFNLSTKITWR